LIFIGSNNGWIVPYRANEYQPSSTFINLHQPFSSTLINLINLYHKNIYFARMRSTHSFKRLLPALFVLLAAGAAQAQLDSIHWIPPMHARSEWGPQYLYISTPETTPFPVEIRDAQGTVISTLTISNAQPARFSIGSSDDTYTLVPDTDLHKPLQDKGLVIVGTQKFYVAFRAHSSSQYQACDLTCKGRAALGKTFRIGHLIQGSSSSPSRSNFIGIMATEDSTLVTLSDYDPSVRFRINGVDTQVPGSVQLVLQAGESAVIS